MHVNCEKAISFLLFIQLFCTLSFVIRNIPHIPVSHLLNAVSPSSLFRRALTIPPTEQKEREGAEQTWIEFGNDCSDVAKQPNIPQWKRPLPSLCSFLPASAVAFSVSLSHFPLCQRNLLSSWECSFNLEILPCVSEAWDSAQGRAWLLLLQLSNVHYSIFITLGVLIALQLGSPCGIYAFYPLPLNWLGLENDHMHGRTHVPSATTAETSYFILFSHWQHM